MYFAFGLKDILAMVENFLRGLWADLCEIIYPLIAQAYDLFINIGKLSFSTKFIEVYNRISLIIGIFMVFRVIFWLIEMLVNPDITSDKEKKPGKIIQKVLISVVLLAVTPTIFSYASDLQYLILDKSIIEKIISPDGVDADEISVGTELAANLFINFYTINDVINNAEKQPYNGYSLTEELITEGQNACKKFVGKNTEDGDSGRIYSLFLREQVLVVKTSCLTKRYDEKGEPNASGDYSPYIINFNGIFAVIIGVVVLWMLIMYCIDVGARYAQLVFLQIIAPIPIMCYLVPGKDNMFTKWVKQCTTTYLDVFIRVAIISFIMFLSNAVMNNLDNILGVVGGENVSWVMQVFLVLGLLMFAKKAPELIQELLPKSVTKASGNFGLSLKKRTDSMLGGKLVTGAARMATAGVAGAAVVGATGFLSGRRLGDRLTGLVGGAFRGLGAGTKNGSVLKNLDGAVKQQQNRNRQKFEWAQNGSTLGGRMAQRMANTFGYEDRAGIYEKQIELIDKDIREKRESISKKKRQSATQKEVLDTRKQYRSDILEDLKTKTYEESDVRRNLQKRYFDAEAKLNIAQNAKPKDFVSGAQQKYEEALRVYELNKDNPNSRIGQVAKANFDKARQEYDEAKIRQKREEDRIAEQIAAAREDFNKIEKETVDAIEGHLLSNEIPQDDGLYKKVEHIKNIMATDTDGSFEGMQGGLDSFASIKALEKAIKERNSEISEEIAVTERLIKVKEDEKAEIQSSDEKKAAEADKKAVSESGKRS